MSGIRRTRRTCNSSGCPTKRRPLLSMMLSMSSKTNVGDKVLVRRNCNCSPSMRRQRSSKTYMERTLISQTNHRIMKSDLQSVICELGHPHWMAVDLHGREGFGILRQLFLMNKSVAGNNTILKSSITYCLHWTPFRKSKPPVAVG